MRSDQEASSGLASPWVDFLDELDALLAGPAELHCLGGFVLTVLYARSIPTADIDCVAVIPQETAETLQQIAGPQSELATKHRVHFQFVTVADCPENYESRLREMFPGRFSKLRLLALEAHDVALSKLTRNSGVDRRDVEFLAKKGVLDPTVLEQRYHRELRPYLANEERHDLTLKLWLEDYFQHN